MRPYWIFVVFSALTSTAQPLVSNVTIPAGMILRNRDEIHFNGTIKPQYLQLVSGPIEGPFERWKVEATVENFPYSPNLFAVKRVKTGSRMVFTNNSLTNMDVLTEALVLKSNLTFTAEFLSSPQTNFDALGRRTIVPAKPQFRYVQIDPVTPEASRDVRSMNGYVGVYRMDDSLHGKREKLDLRRDGSGFWFGLDDLDKVTSKKSVAWSAANGKVVLRFENTSREMRIEGDDMLDAQGNRWLHTR